MKLLIVAIVLCVTQCQARDHKRQYYPPLPEDYFFSSDIKTTNNEDDDPEHRYTWDDLRSDVKYFTLNKLSQFKKVFDSKGWTNLSRLAAAWIEWLSQRNGVGSSTVDYRHN